MKISAHVYNRDGQHQVSLSTNDTMHFNQDVALGAAVRNQCLRRGAA